MFTIYIVLLMSSATAMVLFMLCSAFEAVVCRILFVMYGSSDFYSFFISLREVRWVGMMCLCSCLW